MPNQQATPPQIPSPTVITPALLKTHSITPDEYTRIEQGLGRTPSLTELGIFSVMWSEHCSYKSSRVHLKRLPTKGTRLTGPGSVVQGPGENAGIIDVGEGWACAFKIESHNHPSYIEPYQGAATGVGGILRDIFTMGARPLAVMDSLRFGPLQPEPSVNKLPGAPSIPASSEWVGSTTADPIDYARNRHTMQGVVHGVGGYGNCFGVPNLGGETRFEPCYSGNPLLNAFALGLVRTDEIFYAKAEGVGNPVFYVGAKTGRDGIHGATMASEEFTEGSEQKRPNVQMGDPFLEKLLLEACLEVMKTGAVLGIQDMGAAGLTCSTCEMGARGSLGVTIELDRVPQRETGMSTYEIMLSESQERMLLVAEKGREEEVLAVFRKWGLDCAEVGIVTADDVMRVYHHGVLQAEIPNKALTDDAPVYHRPVGTWTPPVPKDPPAWVLEELKKPRDYTADLRKLLASANICSKHYIFEQYDSMVQTNTVQGPGGEAGVIRIKGTGQPRTAILSQSSSSGKGHPERSPSASSTDAVEGPRESSPATASRTTSTGTSDLPPFVGAATLAAPAEGLDPAPVEHSLLGKLANLVAASTPKGEATLLTGQENATNPVVFPTEPHTAPAAAEPSLITNHFPLSTVPERGLAMALAGNGRWCYLDPKLGAMHAVAEAARKVACTGATPVAATNCLNFGNPEKPEIMAQLSATIDGIAEACTALGTPVTGGNVSLYNETRGEGIYPTPVIGIVGILDDVTKAVPSAFQRTGDVIVLLTLPSTISGTRADREFGSSEYAKTVLQTQWGTPPSLQLLEEFELQNALRALAEARIVHSASDVSDGGIVVALARACIPNNIGAWILLNDYNPRFDSRELFREDGSLAIVTCSRENLPKLKEIVDDYGFVYPVEIGHTVTTDQIDKDHDFTIGFGPQEAPVIQTHVSELRAAYSAALESQLAEEVFA
jgi:phosphoribosylformylglycinamidine (FGAM) synthase-like enzyme